jgi:hypothetical protein
MHVKCMPKNRFIICRILQCTPWTSASAPWPTRTTPCASSTSSTNACSAYLHSDLVSSHTTRLATASEAAQISSWSPTSWTSARCQSMWSRHLVAARYCLLQVESNEAGQDEMGQVKKSGVQQGWRSIFEVWSRCGKITRGYSGRVFTFSFQAEM